MKRLIMPVAALVGLSFAAWANGPGHRGNCRGNGEATAQAQCRRGQGKDREAKRQNPNCRRPAAPPAASSDSAR